MGGDRKERDGPHGLEAFGLAAPGTVAYVTALGAPGML